jgi:hypothetical protein
MEVPKVGSTQGIFEIFVPGLFLLLNLCGSLYLCSWLNDDVSKIFIKIFKNAGLLIIIVIPFGYFAGVILRLFKTRMVDTWSGKFSWFIFGKRKLPAHLKEHFTEPFPYFKYMSYICDRKMLPDEASKFNTEVWQMRNQVSYTRGNREFFNYCKVQLHGDSDKSFDDIFSSEALSRYISSMFYALCMSILMVAIVAVSHFLSGVFYISIFVIALYLIGIYAILRNFRFLRMKEVETVFAATLKHYYSKVEKDDIAKGVLPSENIVVPYLKKQDKSNDEN